MRERPHHGLGSRVAKSASKSSPIANPNHLYITTFKSHSLIRMSLEASIHHNHFIDVFVVINFHDHHLGLPLL